VAISVYIGVGCLHKQKTVGVSGVEAIPHIAFWRELPGLVQDCVAFTATKVRALFGWKKPTTFDDL